MKTYVTPKQVWLLLRNDFNWKDLKMTFPYFILTLVYLYSTLKVLGSITSKPTSIYIGFFSLILLVISYLYFWFEWTEKVKDTKQNIRSAEYYEVNKQIQVNN